MLTDVQRVQLLFYDNAVEDNIMNDRDFEAPAISNEEISNITNNRVITRR